MSTPSSTPSDRKRGPNDVFCRDCGAIIDERAEICPSCGVRQRDPPKSTADSALDDLLEGGNPFVAGLLSAIFPGLGQLYNRELERALAFAVGIIIATFSTLAFVGFLLVPVVWLFAIYDAYTRAELRAEERRAEEREEAPDEGGEESAALAESERSMESDTSDDNDDSTASDESQS
ncbi:zinc ribbon domain-containing protein [Haloferax larsenii]|uniref:Zinc ribbon domain-containing protein n=1 Tax=Haloferax larsenii TaxID=302484 RepID=A0ABY5RKL9_HALLR|nr:zinc ribbon domain-containing protein [Haloferax larsenii]UVE51740.1 zinc ribbon domain-containing protein [Haloferax larsenii]